MRVETVSRLHMGLLDLNGELGRIDGGVGLSLDEPSIAMTGELSRSLDVEGPMADRVEGAAERVLEEIDGEPVSIEVERTYPQHVGLGSGTQAALAAGTLASRLNGEELPVRRIAELTGRGGTSGIGVAVFDGGGFLLDGGHDFDAKGSFLPSAASDASPPPVLSRLEFPDWDVAVIVPEGRGAHGKEEIDVFEEECPIPAGEVEGLCRLVVMKLLPAVAEGDFDSFREAVRGLQETGFKRRELERKPRSRELIEELHDEGFAAGMSSFGPTVYAVHPDELELPEMDAEIIETEANFGGAEVTG